MCVFALITGISRLKKTSYVLCVRYIETLDVLITLNIINQLKTLFNKPFGMIFV